MNLFPRRPAGRMRLFPHEWLGLAFVAFGVYLLENLPVTYSRSALFLAYSVPVALIGAVALTTVLIVRKLRPAEKTRDLLLWIVRSLLLLTVVMPVHFLLKSFIYLINPRVRDLQLMAIDRLLLFGHSPSIFFAELFENAALLRAIDIVYSGIYYFLLVIHVGVLMVLPAERYRKIFIASYSSMWIVGMLLYLAIPSWGPVFVQPEIFERCLAYMPGTVNVQSVLYEEISSLVRDPLGTRVVRFGCVAAFPSLHLAVVTLFVLASHKISQRWFLFNFVVAAIMFIGSIVTGYHYLSDSIAGVILAILLWFGWRRVYRPGPASSLAG